MRANHLVFLTAMIGASAFAHGSTVHTETVEETPRTETQRFCAKTNAEEAKRQCDSWLQRQLKTLGDKVLTSNCSNGDMTTDTSCLFRADGEVTYALKKHKSSTEHH